MTYCKCYTLNPFLFFWIKLCCWLLVQLFFLLFCFGLNWQLAILPKPCPTLFPERRILLCVIAFSSDFGPVGAFVLCVFFSWRLFPCSSCPFALFCLCTLCSLSKHLRGCSKPYQGMMLKDSCAHTGPCVFLGLRPMARFECFARMEQDAKQEKGEEKEGKRAGKRKEWKGARHKQRTKGQRKQTDKKNRKGKGAVLWPICLSAKVVSLLGSTGFWPCTASSSCFKRWSFA